MTTPSLAGTDIQLYGDLEQPSCFVSRARVTVNETDNFTIFQRGHTTILSICHSRRPGAATILNNHVLEHLSSDRLGITNEEGISQDTIRLAFQVVETSYNDHRVRTLLCGTRQRPRCNLRSSNIPEFSEFEILAAVISNDRIVTVDQGTAYGVLKVQIAGNGSEESTAFIMGSHGFWEGLTREEAIQIVRENERELIAVTLVNQAMERSSTSQDIIVAVAYLAGAYY